MLRDGKGMLLTESVFLSSILVFLHYSNSGLKWHRYFFKNLSLDFAGKIVLDYHFSKKACLRILIFQL